MLSIFEEQSYHLGLLAFMIDRAHALPQDADQAVYLFKYLYELLGYILVQEDNCNPVM